MFGHSYFGASYFGPHYWGPAAQDGGGSSTGLWWKSPPKKKTRQVPAQEPPATKPQPTSPPILDLRPIHAQHEMVAQIAERAEHVSSRLMRQMIEADDEAILLRILQ
jgi:hypothetical protein